MYVHSEKKIYWTSPPRTASRAVSTVVKLRGFHVVFGHHGFPGYVSKAHLDRFDRDPQSRKSKKWRTGPPTPEYRHGTVIRNHYDYITALYYWSFARVDPIQRITKDYVEGIHKNPALKTYLPLENRLWPFTDLPNTVIVRFEHLRESLNEALLTLGLEELGENELKHVPHHKNKYKDENSLWKIWDEEAIEAVTQQYGPEMEKFGYTFENSKINERR